MNKKHSCYIVWKNMRQRCNNPKYPQYDDYGGRGIKVCDEWNDFKIFAKDMGERPKGMTLDRKENDKGYSKENCRWANRNEQARNTRQNRLITFKGETLTLKDWSEKTNLDYDAIRCRLDNGWSVEDALTKPSWDRGQEVTIDGVTYKSIRKAHKATGISIWDINKMRNV